MILKITPNIAKPFDCTKSGISRCHGKCCTNLPSFWPHRAYPFGCPYISAIGCTLSIQDRPIDCLIYPLFINYKGSLQIHNHCYHKKWMCNPNMGVGEPLVDNIGEMLVELFGLPAFLEMRASAMEGKWCQFSTTTEFDLQREVEELSIKFDLPIIPRRSISMELPDLIRENIRRNGIPVSKHYREV